MIEKKKKKIQQNKFIAQIILGNGWNFLSFSIAIIGDQNFSIAFGCQT